MCYLGLVQQIYHVLRMISSADESVLRRFTSADVSCVT